MLDGMNFIYRLISSKDICFFFIFISGCWLLSEKNSDCPKNCSAGVWGCSPRYTPGWYAYEQLFTVIT